MNVAHRSMIAWRRALSPLFGVLVFVVACSGGGGSGASGQPVATGPAAVPQPASPPAPASVSVKLEASSALAGAPFNVERSLVIPPGFGIRVWSRVANARFMALAPNGDVLVSVPSEGRIVLLRERANDVPEQFDFATGLSKPHDLVFHAIGSTIYLYFAESNRVSRAAYEPGATRIGNRETVVDNLPDSSLPELGGAYGHELKNIAFGPDNRLYVSVASNCNACAEDAEADPVRGAIYQYTADGKERKLFARGLRNAEGLDFIPGTNNLWVVVNNRDEIRVPVDVDIDGDGESDRGRQLAAYVDDNPTELFTVVREGGNYGWPFCNPVANPAMANLDTLPDYEHNRDETRLACAAVSRGSKGIRAHAAPLGFSFLHASNVPLPYRKGAVVAQHGCWNCTALHAGYRVTYFPFDDAGNSGAEMDLIAGFVNDPAARSFWGRPVDAIADGRGGILVSDDFAGAVYQLYPK